MQLHQTSGRWRLGLFLSLITVMLWGILPIALSILIGSIDIYTVTWFRFFSSSVVLILYLTIKHPDWWRTGLLLQQLTSLQLTRREWLLLLTATFCMGADYILFLNGIVGTSPTNAEVLAQLAPALMALGAIAVFKERFIPRQFWGVGVLVCGFVMFFHDKLQVLETDVTAYWQGNIFVILASIIWATYALLQKQLLQKFSSSAATLMIYLLCTLTLTPFARPHLVLTLNAFDLGLLAFCSLNALVSFAAFAESLNHLEASKISAISTLSPVFTFLSVGILSGLVPEWVAPEAITPVGILGALIIIAGSTLIAVGESSE